MISAITKTGIFILILLGIFLLARIGLYIAHYDFFAELTLFETLFAFIHGVRFDLSIGLTFLFLFLLLLNLPFKIFVSKIYNQITSWVFLLAMIVYIFILVGDILYFGYVKRHLADELLLLQGDKTFLLDMVPVYWIETLLGFIFIAMLAYFWKKLAAIEVKKNPYPWITFVALFLLFFVAIRGSVGTKPISVVNAYTSGNSKEASLTLNGVFTAYHYGRRSQNEDFSFYPQQEALEILGLQEREFPLKKSYAQKRSNLNVVVVMMESWSPRYIDSYGADLGITPNFDAFAKKGVKFTNFYASGQRSIEGIQAALTGVPPIKGVPSLGFGLEIANITRLGEILERNNYEKVFLQTSKRGSFYMDAIATALGFDRYFGMEDMPPLLEYPDPEGAKFGWDYEGYMKLFDALESPDEQNFFAFLFTGSTHTPYPRLPAFLEKYPYDGEEQSFYNLVYYSDYALGEFMKKAKTKEWFEDTVFIFTADHAMAHYQSGEFLEGFHVPFVIYSPKHFAPAVETKIASQIQIMPTIIDILGFDDSFYAFDDSLFKTDAQAAFIYSGGIVGAITKKGYLKHSYSNRLETTLDKQLALEVERRILAKAQITSRLIKENRFAQ